MNTGEFSLFTPLLALGFGLLSFLSPCCLPLLPAYLGMIAGSAGSAREGQGRWPLLWNGLAFVAGLSLVFAVLGASASALGLLMLEQRLLLIQLGGAADRAVRSADAWGSAPGVAGAHLSARRS